MNNAQRKEIAKATEVLETANSGIATVTSTWNDEPKPERGWFVTALDDALNTMESAVEELRNTYENMASEERDKYDNLSEGLQQSEKGQNISDAADNLEQGMSEAEDLLTLITGFQETLAKPDVDLDELVSEIGDMDMGSVYVEV